MADQHNPFSDLAYKMDVMMNHVRKLEQEVRTLREEMKLDAQKLTFTLQEAEQATGLSYHTLYNMVQTGRMDTLQPGGVKGKILVERSELLRALREHQETDTRKLKVAR